MQQLEIEWKYFDQAGNTCLRCSDTGETLQEVVNKLATQYGEKGIAVRFKETLLDASDLSQSNQILFNGTSLEDLVSGAQLIESHCKSCCEMIGEDVSCRAVVVEGVTYEAIPEKLIRQAAHAAVNMENKTMKNVKVLGTGCANCRATLKLIEDTAKAKGVEVQLEKVENIADILGYGVMSTPGVVIDGKVVHAGGVPSKAVVEGWLS